MVETTSHSPRFLRGLAIARVGRVRQLRDGVWSVPSQSHRGAYLVDTAGDRPACCCPDFEDTGNSEGFECKHITAVRVTSGEIEIPDDVTDEQPGKRRTYSQDWHAYNLAQTRVPGVQDVGTLKRGVAYPRREDHRRVTCDDCGQRVPSAPIQGRRAYYV